MNDFFIEKARIKDARNIAQLHIKSLSYVYDLIQKPLETSLGARIESIENAINSNRADHYFLLAKSYDGTIKGFICFGCKRDNDLEYKGEIYALYIDPDYMGHGIGAALFNHAKDIFQKDDKSLGLSQITI